MRKRCPVCGSMSVSVETPSEYRYSDCGLSDVVLYGSGGVVVTKCADCHNTTTMVRQEQQLLQSLGLVLLGRAPGMTGEEMRYLRTLFEMTQDEFARALKVRRATVSDWERSKRVTNDVGTEIVHRLVLLTLFNERVIESDHCFLQKPHLRRFGELMESFVQTGMKMLDQKRPRRRRTQVRHHPRKKSWEADLVLV